MRRGLQTVVAGLALMIGSAGIAQAQFRGVNASDPHLYGAGPASGFAVFNPNYRTSGVGLNPTGYNTAYVVPGTPGAYYPNGNLLPGRFNFGYGPGYGFGASYGPTPYAGGFNGVGFGNFPYAYGVPGYGGYGAIGLPSYGVTYGQNVTGFGMSGYRSSSSQSGAFGIPFSRGFYQRGYSTGFYP